jgi:hypothetical protein
MAWAAILAEAGCVHGGLQVLAVLANDPSWSTAQLLQDGRGRAAVALGSALLALTAIQWGLYMRQHRGEDLGLW